MVELLVSFVQSACLIGYLYGAYVVITNAAGGGSQRSALRMQSDQHLEDDDPVSWRRYLECDL